MNIIIAGDGKVGSTLTRQLTSEGYDVTVIDSDPRVLESSVERYDVTGIQGNCAAMSVLLQAGVRDADLLIAATNLDEVNLLCCTTAHALNPRLHTIARVRNPEYTEQIYKMRDVFGLSMLFNPENQAASEIERLLKYPGFLRRDVFARGRAEIVELRIDKNSKLLNVRLVDMTGIIKCRVLVCAVLRDGTAVVPNSGDFTFREGDRIFVTAPTRDLTALLKNLDIITRRVRRVLLCGGGRISYYLASKLKKAGISSQIIESNYDRCRELCELLPECDIILEPNSTNTKENILFTRTKLEELGLPAGHVLGVHQPFMERRISAAIGVYWPELKFTVTSPQVSIPEYLRRAREQGISENASISVIVGDFQRMDLYAKLGYQLPQHIPEEAWQAFHQLVAMGYDRQLAK